MNDNMELNKVEIWIAEHSIRIFLVMAVLIVAAGVAAYLVYEKQGDTQHQVDVLKPQVTKVIAAARTCSLDASRESQESRECAQRLRIALLNCRQYRGCREALVLASTPPPEPSRSTSTTPSTTTAPSSEGVMPQTPSTGHQQPGPGDPGHSGGDHGQEASPAPSPGSSAAPWRVCGARSLTTARKPRKRRSGRFYVRGRC